MLTIYSPFHMSCFNVNLPVGITSFSSRCRWTWFWFVQGSKKLNATVLFLWTSNLCNRCVFMLNERSTLKIKSQRIRFIRWSMNRGYLCHRQNIGQCFWTLTLYTSSTNTSTCHLYPEKKERNFILSDLCFYCVAFIDTSCISTKKFWKMGSSVSGNNISETFNYSEYIHTDWIPLKKLCL